MTASTHVNLGSHCCTSEAFSSMLKHLIVVDCLFWVSKLDAEYCSIMRIWIPNHYMASTFAHVASILLKSQKSAKSIDLLHYRPRVNTRKVEDIFCWKVGSFWWRAFELELVVSPVHQLYEIGIPFFILLILYTEYSEYSLLSIQYNMLWLNLQIYSKIQIGQLESTNKRLLHRVPWRYPPHYLFQKNKKGTVVVQKRESYDT